MCSPTVADESTPVKPETFEQRVHRLAAIEDEAIGGLVPGADEVHVPLLAGEPPPNMTYPHNAWVQLRLSHIRERACYRPHRVVVFVAEEAPHA